MLSLGEIKGKLIERMKRSHIICIIGFALIVVLCFPALYTCQTISIGDFTKTGQIGDTIGGITAPFIGLINIGLLIWTLWEQLTFNKRQIVIQKEEQFKSTFFQMLGTQRELLHETKGRFLSRSMRDAETIDGMVRGMEYFHIALVELKTLFQTFESFDDNHKKNDNVVTKYTLTEDNIKAYKGASKDKKIEIVYKCFFSKHAEMGNYFRHLYHILKFIDDEKEETKKEKVDEEYVAGGEDRFNGYADILQATLSFDELCMAYYNCSAYPHAKTLLIKYKFVENLPKKNLHNKGIELMDGFDFIKEEI